MNVFSCVAAIIFVEKTKGTEGNHRRFQLRSSDHICSNKKHKTSIRCSAPKQRIEIKNKDHFTQIDADNNVADIRR
ncbi:hypothetical protein C0T31_08055 [Dysgonamonadaceae bacterium]|nr:hypothetical protein C0T31_08055 [Dysgonamonadaceae bacterium]